MEELKIFYEGFQFYPGATRPRRRTWTGSRWFGPLQSQRSRPSSRKIEFLGDSSFVSPIRRAKILSYFVFIYLKHRKR
jgi:hypothetical protein